MFFVFGFGKRTSKEIGMTSRTLCPNCGNIRKWHYNKITSWFTLFFIPVIPYKTICVKICPICNANILADKDEITE